MASWIRIGSSKVIAICRAVAWVVICELIEAEEQITSVQTGAPCKVQQTMHQRRLQLKAARTASFWIVLDEKAASHRVEPRMHFDHRACDGDDARRRVNINRPKLRLLPLVEIPQSC
jgi:hypothetical protein